MVIAAYAARKQAVPFGAQPVQVMRASRAGAHLSMEDPAFGLQRAEVLAHRADRDAEGFGEFVDAGFASPLQRVEQRSPRRRNRVEEHGVGHRPPA